MNVVELKSESDLNTRASVLVRHEGVQERSTTS